jgi:site-specific DNA-methyltransferase (adenine-specific)
VDKLAISIQKYGLIHPIVVDREFNLIAGYRRLEAHKALKLTEIDVNFRDQLSELEKKEIELEENIQRQDLSWIEIVNAKRELDDIKRRIYGYADRFNPDGWGLEDTAQALGESVVMTKRDILLAKAIEVMPELAKCKTKTDAFKALKSERGKMARAELVKRAEERFRTEPQESLIQVIHGDCLVEMKKLNSETFHMAISDPPFGVGLDSMVNATGSSVMPYIDTKENMFKLYSESIKEVARLLKPNSHFYQFFPIGEDYGWYLKELRDSFDYVDAIPIVWVKNKGGFTVDARFRYQPRYQPIFFCSKGRRALKMGLENGNVLTFNVVEGKLHPAEAPPELMEVLIEQSSLPGESVLDPFAGSGATGVAAKRSKRRATLIEMKEDYVNLIKSKIYD